MNSGLWIYLTEKDNNHSFTPVTMCFYGEKRSVWDEASNRQKLERAVEGFQELRPVEGGGANVAFPLRFQLLWEPKRRNLEDEWGIAKLYRVAIS